MNALSTAVEAMKPIDCPHCDDGFLLEAGGVLVCNECGSEAMACHSCGGLNVVDNYMGSTICDRCGYHWCDKCKEEMRPATYYQEPDGSAWLNTEAYCYRCERRGCSGPTEGYSR